MISVAADLARAFADAPDDECCPFGALLFDRLETISPFEYVICRVTGYELERVSSFTTGYDGDGNDDEDLDAYRLGVWFHDGQRAAKAIEAMGRCLGGER